MDFREFFVNVIGGKLELVPRGNFKSELRGIESISLVGQPVGSHGDALCGYILPSRQLQGAQRDLEPSTRTVE